MELFGSNHRKAILAGFIGTFALSVLMVLKMLSGFAPQMNPIRDLTGLAHDVAGLPRMMPIGWVLHFVIGSVVWGTVFTLLHPILGGSNRRKGVIVALLAWLLMMVGFMPMSGNGLFGFGIGPMIPVMTFVFHVVFGLVMGTAYSWLTGEE